MHRRRRLSNATKCASIRRRRRPFFFGKDKDTKTLNKKLTFLQLCGEEKEEEERESLAFRDACSEAFRVCQESRVLPFPFVRYLLLLLLLLLLPEHLEPRRSWRDP